MEKNSQLGEYEEFLKKVFPKCQYNKEYDLLFENNSEITRGHFNRGVL